MTQVIAGRNPGGRCPFFLQPLGGPGQGPASLPRPARPAVRACWVRPPSLCPGRPARPSGPDGADVICPPPPWARDLGRETSPTPQDLAPPTRREGPRLGLGGCCHGPGHGRGGINRCCPPRACSPVPGTGRSSMIGAAAFALPRSREVRYEPIGEPKLNAVRLVSNTRAATSGATLTSQISCASGDRRAVQI